ncbi:O-antigen/teichoic acid export membrane protein [Flavobacteriaceae bacterium MAR_2009_75]|nr:O-antigen/teichoic acid export membrane protein [Flavobacteriaceae bacterium MAR_2009_75]
MSTQKRIFKYLFSNTISSGVNFFSKWFMNYSLAKLMTLEGFGVFSFIMAISNLFKGFISFGGQLYLIYKVSKEKENKYLNFFKSCLLSLIVTIISLLLIAGAYALNIQSINSKHFLYAISIAFCMAFIQNIYSFFKGVKLFSKETKGYILLLIFIIFLAVGLYYKFIINDLKVILSIVLIIHFILLAFAAGQWYSYFKKNKSNEDFTRIRTKFGSFIKDRVSYGLHEMQSVLYVNATILVLGFMVKEEDLAIYKSLQIIIVPFSILPMIFSQVLLTQLTENIKKDRQIMNLFRSFLWITTLIGTLLLILVYSFGKEVIVLFYQDKLSSSTNITEIIILLTIAYFFRFISANYGVLITANDKQKIRVYATGLLIFVTIISTVVLTNYMGIVGAAYANALSYFVLMITYVIYSEYKLLRQC